MKKRVLSILTALALTLGLCTPLGGLMPEAKAAEIASGTCGAGLAWTLDGEGTLVISGTGAMEDFEIDMSSRPWGRYLRQIETIVIQPGVTSIGDYAFFIVTNLDNNYVKSVSIPSTVTRIGDWAFGNCGGLEQITISDNVTEVGEHAFEDTGLRSVTIGSGITELPKSIFSGCNYLTDVILSEGVKVISGSAFWSCTSLEGIRLPSSVTAVYYGAFENCSALEYVVLGSGITEFSGQHEGDSNQSSVFYQCTSLKDIYYPGGQEAFSQIKNSTYVARMAGIEIHYNSDGPEDKDSESEVPTSFIPTPVLERAEYINGAVEVEWTTPLNTVDTTYTADGFYVLRKTGGGSYERIATVQGDSFGTYRDTSVTEGQTYTYTVQAYYQGQTGGYDAAGLTVKAEDPAGVSDDLVYEIVDGHVVITDCRETATQVVIPAQIEGYPVTHIGSAAFRDCKQLTSVTLPDCLTVVGSYAFENCTALTSIDLTHVISIGERAFAWCSKLVDIRCGPDLSALGEDALSGWSGLLVVTGYVRTPAELQCSMEGVKFRYIPSNVTVVNNGTFEYPDANGDTASYTFYYNDSFFSYDNSQYHSDLAVMSLKLAMAGYSRQDLYTETLDEDDLRRALNLQRLFSDMGFGNAQFENYNVALTDDSSKVAYGFASKQIGQDVVVAVVLRGGGYGAEWVDNFNVGTSGDHKGFSTAAKAVQADLEDYIAGLKDLYSFSGDVKLWMTGYSRSAATCNLLAQAMSSQIEGDDLYAYVFAAPNCTTSPKACQGLYTIISGTDLVPCVPLSKWGFGHHGTVLTFPSILPEVRKDEFEELSGIDLDSDDPVARVAQPAAIQLTINSLGTVISSRSMYNSMYAEDLQRRMRLEFASGEPYSIGDHLGCSVAYGIVATALPFNIPTGFLLKNITRSHQPTYYLAWLEAGTLNSIDDFDASGKMVSFGSNANVQIKNSAGEIIATVRNHIVTAGGALSGIQVECVDGQTTLFLSDGSYTLEIYGSGTADLSILEFAADSSVSREVVFEDVALKSTVMALDISASEDGESYRLEDGTGMVKPADDTKTEEAEPAGSTGAFTDVSTGAWYYDAVQWAVENGITTGTSATTFSPDRLCTRGEVVTLIWRALGLDDLNGRSTDNPFRDVYSDAYYHDAVLWAVENGITTGTGVDTFSPNAVCDRAQVVTFLWRTDYPPKKISGPVGFQDVHVGDYFWFPVKWAVDNGITTGTGGNVFSPYLACTRAQVVTFLYRDFA